MSRRIASGSEVLRAIAVLPVGGAIRGGVRERNDGFPQELTAAVQAVLDDTEPPVTCEDSKAVLGITLAAYESTGTGRRVELPVTPPEGKKPIGL